MEHPDLGQVQRDFCSARQAYTQAQQEEVTEERDLRPIPKKHLEYEVSQGGIVRENTLPVRPPNVTQISIFDCTHR